MPPMSSKTSTITTPPHLPHAPWIIHNRGDLLRRGVMSEYNLVYQTLCFSGHLQSPSVYSDTLHSRLCRLCNNCTAPCICAPTHAPSLFVYLFTFVIGACVAFFVCLLPVTAGDVGGIALCIPNQSILHNFILQNIWRNIIIGNTEE